MFILSGVAEIRQKFPCIGPLTEASIDLSFLENRDVPWPSTDLVRPLWPLLR
jgi:hypothetical protein